MMNVSSELASEQDRQLQHCYATLQWIAKTSTVPSVQAATRSAIAQLHVALDGQALDFEYYSHRWDDEEHSPRS